MILIWKDLHVFPELCIGITLSITEAVTLSEMVNATCNLNK